MAPDTSVRVEFQIANNSKLVSTYKTMGEVKDKFSKLRFVKYIYFDSSDGLLKGINPPDKTPIVSNAYITVAGNLENIIKFAEFATSN